jgi:phosphodiesterase/alkaline phosphatase D-like protein
LRFGVSGDWRGELAPYPSIANAADSDLEFFVELGDTIYADFPSPAVPAARARSLAEFRAKHNEVYSERFGMNTFAELRSATSIFAMIDDHEVANDFAGGAVPSSDPRFDNTGSFINETALYRTALQAFHEYNPIRSLTYETPNHLLTQGKPKLYRTQTYGSDAAIFLLDARSFATPNSRR